MNTRVTMTESLSISTLSHFLRGQLRTTSKGIVPAPLSLALSTDFLTLSEAARDPPVL